MTELSQFAFLAQATGVSAAPAPGSTPAPATPAAPDALGTGTTTSQPGTTAAPGGAQPAPSAPSFLPLLLILMAVMMVPMWLSSRREKKKRETVMSQLKRKDKVLTIGGLIGTVVDIRDNEVVLSTDEPNGARFRVTRSSIQTVLESFGSGNSAGAKPEVEVKAKSDAVSV